MGPGSGVLLTVADRDKPECLEAARLLAEAGWSLYATRGTARYLAAAVTGIDWEDRGVLAIQDVRPRGIVRAGSSQSSSTCSLTREGAERPKRTVCLATFILDETRSDSPVLRLRSYFGKFELDTSRRIL